MGRIGVRVEAREQSSELPRCPSCGSTEVVPCFIEALEMTTHYGKQRICLLCKTIWTPGKGKC